MSYKTNQLIASTVLFIILAENHTEHCVDRIITFHVERAGKHTYHNGRRVCVNLVYITSKRDYDKVGYEREIKYTRLK